MPGNKLKGVITGIISVIVVITLFFVGAIIMKNKYHSYKEEREIAEADFDEQIRKEMKADPESGKIILTDSLMKVVYARYYEGHKEAVKVFGMFRTFFVIVVIVIVVVTIFSHVWKSLRNGRSPSIIRIAFCILPLPIMFAALFFFSSAMTSGMGPEPDKADIRIYQIDVNRKDTKVTSDSDGNDTTNYYIYYIAWNGTANQEVRLMVTSKMYEAVTEPGTYYYVSASGDGSKEKGFAIYSTKDYVKSGMEV